MTQLSPNFSFAEMTVTKCGLPNSPNSTQLRSMTTLCTEVLEKIRAHFGKPVIVTSGFRSEAVNRDAGGASNSQHLLGEAADIHIPGVANSEIWQWVVDNLDFDQIIAEKLQKDVPDAGWIHVSYRAGRLRKDAKSFVNGKYVKGLHFV